MMKRFYLSAIGAGFALAVISGPMAVAQQYQNHDDMHGMAPMHAMPMQHMAPHYVAHPVAYGHSWHNGDRYTGGRVVVSNWQMHHLHRPPHGYEWVQNGGQYVLIAVASGIVADAVVNALVH